MKHRLIGAVVAASLLVLPAAAGASVTKTVYAGPPPIIRQIAAKILANPKQFVQAYPARR